MQIDTENEFFQLAWYYVTDTMRTVYLTGKAGTGKTTFLKYLKEHSPKNMVIVAPTGVAAINAGGVTMHSMFQLPLKPFVAQMPLGFGRNERVADKHYLLKNLRMNDTKRKLLRELELLVIDEVSMMRADHLEAIHHVLKSVRRNPNPFGGVQVLFIGDLYQLPPVVVDSERDILEEHYKSPYFFDAPIMKELHPLYIELKKVYRQKDSRFIELLNRIRINELSLDDYNYLHECYAPNFVSTDLQYITVTSHNHKAEAINQEELQRLATPKFSYEGIIDRDFGDKQLPTDRVLVLKVGAQVMFIRNDNTEEKQYYNGKLATVVALNEQDIFVEFPGEKNQFKVPREIWENITYDLDEEKNMIEERVAGTFTQFPLRLAWAITIHKSQGLTFERAIIDAGASFAPGQVYVALSRCTTMEGMKLRSKISPGAIMSDPRIQHFAQGEVDAQELRAQLSNDQKMYQIEKFRKLFTFQYALHDTEEFLKETASNKLVGTNHDIVSTLTHAKQSLDELDKTAQRFLPELQQLILRNEEDKLLVRISKALNYFTKSLFDDVILPLKKIRDVLHTKKGVRGYEGKLTVLQEALWNKLQRFYRVTYKEKPFDIDKAFLLNSNYTSNTIEHKVEVAKEKKPEKGKSAKVTLDYFEEGKSVDEIMALRDMARSTIEGHLYTFVRSGELNASSFVTQQDIDRIMEIKAKQETPGSKEIFETFQGKYSYFQIRIALAAHALEQAPASAKQV